MKYNPKESHGNKTGWTPGLLQDDNSELSKWFASRPEARYQVRLVAAEIIQQREKEQHHGIQK